MKNCLHLLRSMRFAIAILTVVAIASTIGSVLEQGQPYVTYISRYGEFWTILFQMTGLNDIYHAWWFFLLLAFMATSTALCLIQNTPGMLREMRDYRENKSLASLLKSPYRHELKFTASAAELRRKLLFFLRQNRFGFRIKDLGHGAYLVAARTGGLRRLGYMLVHGAIVIICVGGLIDGNVGLRLQLFTGSLKIETRDISPDQVPEQSRLDANSGSYRASMSLSEGDTQDSAYLPFNDGYLLQELPFAVHLKQFRIEHYPGGQPKSFTSDLEIIDGPQRLPVTLEVNHPYTYKGVTMYQSGFADGGTHIRMNAQRLDNIAAPTSFSGKVGASAALLIDEQPISIEFVDFHATNVIESQSANSSATATWFTQPGAGEKVRDIGPSVAFKLRNSAGQADDWNVYMNPIEISQAHYLAIGRRKAPDNAWRYIRLPLDDQLSLEPYRRFASRLNDDSARRKAASTIAHSADAPALILALETTTLALLESFSQAGMKGIFELIQASVPSTEQTTAAKLYMELLERATSQLLDTDQPSDTLQTNRLTRDSLRAYDEALQAEIPFFFQLTDFDPVNASGLQLTRAPGAILVYLGCALLALGVCAMYFIRERRLWLRVTPDNTLLMVYTANRLSPVLATEFDAYRATISKLV